MNKEQTHSHPNYVKIYFILLGLFVVSIVGPLIGIKWVTLITAFGIALVKAVMVGAYFMHLNIEKRFIRYILYTALLFMILLFAGLAPDILKSEGNNWVNVSTVNTATIDQH